MSNETKNDERNTYSVDMACMNCSCKRRMEFQCGKEVPRRVTCPNCGCSTMVRVLVEGDCSKSGKWSSGLAECMDVFFNGRSAK